MWHSGSQLIIQCCIIKVEPIKHATHCISPLTVKSTRTGDNISNSGPLSLLFILPLRPSSFFPLSFFLASVTGCWESLEGCGQSVLYVRQKVCSISALKLNDLIFFFRFRNALMTLCKAWRYRWRSLLFMKAIGFHLAHAHSPHRHQTSLRYLSV